MNTNSRIFKFRCLFATLTSALSFAAHGQASNAPPSVTLIAPVDGATFTAPASIAIEAAVNDANFVEAVRFIANYDIVATATGVGSNGQAFATWSNAPAGSYSLTAVATDIVGHVFFSQPISFNITSGATNPPPPPPPPGPTFYFTGLFPTNGEQFAEGQVILLTGTLDDPSNEVTEVAFFLNGSLLGYNEVQTNSPYGMAYSLPWTNYGEGTFNIFAQAYGANGDYVTSITNVITVGTNSAPPPPPPPPPPAPAFYFTMLSPTNGEQFAGSQVIPLTGFLDDPSNQVAQVAFFLNGSLLGYNETRTNTPYGTAYSLPWTNWQPGAFSIFAQAYDASGDYVTSITNAITVGTNSTPPPPPPPPPPVIPAFYFTMLSPTNGEQFAGPGVILFTGTLDDPSNQVTQVGFFVDNKLVGYSSAPSNSPFGIAYSLPWTNQLSGTFTIFAQAYDAGGDFMMSLQNVITVGTNGGSAPPPPPPPPPPSNPLSLYLVSPSLGAIYSAPASVFMQATIADTNPVAAVQFFANSNLIATVTNVAISNLVSATWGAVPAGNYYLNATATDAAGYVASSQPVFISVQTLSTGPTSSNAPPVVSIRAPGRIYISIPATNGLTYCFLSSTNLNTWTCVSTNVATNGVASYVDQMGDQTQKFYRAVPAAAPAN